MDILSALRLKNIFGTPSLANNMPSQGGISETNGMGFPSPENPFENINFQLPQPAGNQVDVGQEGYDVGRRVNDIYTPEHEASDRYNQLISQYPKQQDYHPGFLRRLGSMIVDYSKGPQAGRSLYNEPYTDKLTDWKNQITPAMNAANLERNQNTNERTLAYQTVANELRAHAQNAKEKNDAVNAEIRQKRADVYEWKARHPNMKFLMPKGGNILAVDPTTGKQIDLGISTGTMSEQNKYDLMQENAVERIQETGKQTRQTEGVRQENREDIQDKRAWELGNIPDPDNPSQTIAVKINKITGETVPVTMKGKNVGPIGRPSSSASGKGELPTQSRIRIYNTASQLANSNPELAPFIHVGTPGTNDVQIDQPRETFFGHRGPTKEQYQKITEAIYGPQMAVSHTPTNTPTNVQSKNPSTTQLNIPKGRVAVQDNKGNKFTVPAEQLAEAIKQGYQEIK